jgi:hypothetical protein
MVYYILDFYGTQKLWKKGDPHEALRIKSPATSNPQQKRRAFCA